jgi:predicted transcriptional regulator
MYTSEVFMATESSLISVRVPSDVAHRLEKLSQSVDRSKSYLAAEAIEEYLDLHEWQVQAIQNGLQEIEQGDVVNFVDVKKDLGFLDEN